MSKSAKRNLKREKRNANAIKHRAREKDALQRKAQVENQRPQKESKIVSIETEIKKHLDFMIDNDKCCEAVDRLIDSIFFVYTRINNVDKEGLTCDVSVFYETYIELINSLNNRYTTTKNIIHQSALNLITQALYYTFDKHFDFTYITQFVENIINDIIKNQRKESA